MTLVGDGGLFEVTEARYGKVRLGSNVSSSSSSSSSRVGG